MPTLQEKIKHVVVLMLENRSFDHMLGNVQFASKVEQPTGKETNPDAAGKPVTISFNALAGIDVGPDHAHVGVMRQLTGKPPAAKPPLYPNPVINNSGFVLSYEDTAKAHKPPFPGNGKEIMRCKPQARVPVLATLAREFAVCDHWFASVPGETWPNRNYAHAGTSDGEVNIVKRTFTNDTIFKRLDQAKKQWRVYHDGIPQVWVFTQLWVDLALRGRFHSMDQFQDEVAAGDLPEYTFIEPRHFGKKANSQHPDNPANARSFYAGEALIKQVYDTLTSNPAIWKSTLLLITYDEHGGYYDHVKPQKATRPDKKVSNEGFAFDLLGLRVPAVLVSPWIAKGTVDTTVYDHSAIPRSIRELFAPATAKLSDREDGASTFWRNLTDTVRKDIPKVAISKEANAALGSVTPVASLAAMKGEALPTELEPTEEAYAWLAYNVAKVIENTSKTGVASAGTTFWEDTKGRLITKAAPAGFGMAEVASVATGPAPIVITNADQLSAFGQHVADMMHESAPKPK